MRKCFFILLLLLLTFLSPQAEEVVARAVKSDDEKVIDEKKQEAKKEDDFKCNLYAQHSQLRKHGGTPQTPRARSIERNRLPTPKFSWKADEAKPLSKLVIKLSEQKAYGFQEASLVMTTDICSGRDTFATKEGNYTVLAKSKDHKSNLFGSFVNPKGIIVNANAEAGQSIPAGLRYVPSSMPFYLRLTHEGLGLHAGILPGYPASHGCVRLPSFIAEKLFAAVPLGTPVEIYP